MHCVVLAGGINRRPLEEGYEPDYKAVFPLGERPLLTYVLKALRASEKVDRIGVVGDPDRLASLVGEAEVRSGGDSLFDSIKAALGFYPDQPEILICTADLPLLRPEMVDRFLRACAGVKTPFEDKVLLSVVEREHFVGVFSEFGKNFNRFRGSTISHGNLAVVTPSILHNQQAMSRIDAIYANRESPVGSALALGPTLGLSYVFGVHLLPLLSLEGFAGMLSSRFGLSILPVRSPYPEVALDIDEPGDLVIARRRLGLVG